MSVVGAGRGYLGRLKRFWVRRGLEWVAFLVESFGKNLLFDGILSVCVREMSRRNSGDGG